MPNGESSLPAFESWVEQLAALLSRDGVDGTSAAAAFAARVPASYLERTPPAVAAIDCNCLADLEHPVDGPPAAEHMTVIDDPEAGPNHLRLRVFGPATVELSSFLPVLESFGLVVVEAVPHRVGGSGGSPPVHLDDFGLRLDTSAVPEGPLGWDEHWSVGSDGGRRLVEAVQAVWQGAAVAGSLNQLVLSAGLEWRDIVVLRAYCRYRRQAGTVWTDDQLVEPLVIFPAVTRALLEYFAERFDPKRSGEWEPARQAVIDSLAAVQRLDHDQVLRGFLGLIDATLRTSHYLDDAGPPARRALTLKLDGRIVPDLARPRLFVETFVYSMTTEGLHLRGGPIARGGIRWSDRTDDLRTEVLGLARAQMLKNANIVPTGAKGGFICRELHGGERPPPGRTVGEVVRESYEVFIRALLDITDNVIDGDVVRPVGVRALDGDDPYLVVAADRGTAQLSDLANAISADHGFWLGDAFASGGSHGYDHKAMGITARGAWVAVQQHFRQLGIDVQTEPIRVVGVGDMSGDVFGNGMLRSDRIKLVAAFDHRDIFVDPDPDPARSFAERRRLFELPASTWQDYDRDIISNGGGVWSRATKGIKLSEAARVALGVTEELLSPPELITAILKAPVDLLWFGGIGTFIKGPEEAAADIGDHANDAIRIDARQVRARVVAEGGNLALTQRGRIQYARRGGRVNTDFIDNAAGVATSDREVNLKILLALATAQGRLDAGERDALLAGIENDVAAAVLEQVSHSIIALTRAVGHSARDIDAYEALMESLERDLHLDRRVEALPDAEEINLRREAGAGLVRPELAVLHAYAKTALVAAIEGSALVADPAVTDAVALYFPVSIRQGFGDLIPEHRLYWELAATDIGGEIVDRMGITWASETADELGASLAEVARAYWAARSVVDAPRLWAALEAIAEGADTETESTLHYGLCDAISLVARSYLHPDNAAAGGFTRHSLSEVIARDRAVVDGLIAEVAPAAVIEPDGLGGPVDVDTLTKQSVDPVVAADLLRLRPVARLVGVADLGTIGTAEARSALTGAAEAADAVDARLGVAALEARVAALSPASRWERWQVRSLLDDLATLRRRAVSAALARAADSGESTQAVVAGWAASQSDRLRRIFQLTAQVDPTGKTAAAAPTMAAAALAVRTLEALVSEAMAAP